MKIPSNRVSSVVKFFRERLSGLYEKEEIENFIYYAFNEYMSFSRTDLMTRADETMSESMLLKFNFAVKDLEKHKPIQYILGVTEFYRLRLKVDERVLIPRQETEELVDMIIKENEFTDTNNQHPGETFTILDIGTGSGCIPIALKKNMPWAEVSAVDVSEGALELARENAAMNNVEIDLIHADVLADGTKDKLKTYNIIVSNPPYVLHSEKNEMHSNVLDHEPHLALFVNDNDPLLFYRVIMDIGKVKLKKNGKIYFEINEKQGDALKKLAEGKGFSEVRSARDLNGKDRIITMQLK